MVIQDDIVYELKAVKNACEIEGMKRAHVCPTFSFQQRFN